MAYWLMKSEPDAFSIDDLERVGTEPWDGIRNYQVRNMIRDQMQPGDRAFFYHSNTKVPGIVGIMDIVSEARPDHTAFDPDEKYFDPKSDPDKPRWLLVDVKYVRHTQRVIPLTELKADPAIEDMPLVRRGNRLSIMPVTGEQWDHILSLEDQG
ncbi:EVE domain-containing protein [Guyparkeria halopsychrophila]|uniref:EVE domain-containing protein n=1 Tax=Guyparkeria halopsychrophila TaxID=3139421 RepID=UPI0037C6EAB2